MLRTEMCGMCRRLREREALKPAGRGADLLAPSVAAAMEGDLDLGYVLGAYSRCRPSPPEGDA